MCTMIGEKTAISGSGKGPKGWFQLRQLYVGYDHPYHARAEHAVTIDFVDEASGPSARTAVELDLASARLLAERILATVAQAETYEAGTPAT